MPKYAFKVILNSSFDFAVKDATLSDIFEAKRITDRLEDQYKKENIRITIDEYHHGDEVEEVSDLYELENEIVSIVKSEQRRKQEVLDKLNTVSNLIEKVLGSHHYDSTDLVVSVSLAKIDQYFYFDITVDDFSDYKITLSTQNGAQSSIIRRTANEVLAEITNLQDILNKIEQLSKHTDFDIL